MVLAEKATRTYRAAVIDDGGDYVTVAARKQTPWGVFDFVAYFPREMSGEAAYRYELLRGDVDLEDLIRDWCEDEQPVYYGVMEAEIHGLEPEQMAAEV